MVLQLARELEGPRHRRAPEWVRFDPSLDVLVPTDPATGAALVELASLLLRRQIGVTLRTRGGLDQGRRLVSLARRHPGMLRVEVALFAAEAHLVQTWERGCPPLGARLALAEALRSAGAEVTATLDPILPFVNDDAPQLRALLRPMARAGLTEIVPRWLEDAPGLVAQVEREVSRSSARILDGWFRMPGAARPGGKRGMALQVRRRGLQRLAEVAEPIGLRVVECACAVSWGADRCTRGPAAAVGRRQLELFAHSA